MWIARTICLLLSTVAVSCALSAGQDAGNPNNSKCDTSVRTGKAPTLAITLDNNQNATYKGKLPGAKKGTTVLICVGNEVKKTATTDDNGDFTGGTDTFKVNSGDSIQAQGSDGTKATSPLSEATTATLTVSKTQDQDKPVAVLIGGAEYSAYSAQSQSTNGFLNVFYRGPVSFGHLSGWGRIRLTSTPQQATNGVASVISSPSGLSTQSFANVGQAFDYVVGPSFRVGQNWALIGGFGATTPLSSQDKPVVFVAPGKGTTECSELVDRFSAAAGYKPFLTLNTDPSVPTCLTGGYTNIAFSNQDRTSFYLKYGAGVRTSYPWLFGDCKNSSDSKCVPSYATLDMVFGQDAAVTGGQLRGVVFKMDGLLPIPTGGGSSVLYLFGSSYIRLRRNNNLPPLLLASPTSSITVPSSTVIVLPLRQPDRDYYRLGVGLNINQLWCKVFGSNCSSGTQGASPGAQPSAQPKTTKPKNIT